MPADVDDFSDVRLDEATGPIKNFERCAVHYGSLKLVTFIAGRHERSAMSARDRGFETTFYELTGFKPLPWQIALYRDWFVQGKFPPSCTLPTGLGKTAVVAIWLIALANGNKNVPRRLAYAVNRHTVVDQITEEAEKIRTNWLEKPQLHGVLNKFRSLAISTLRGTFAEDPAWSADPSQPAVICGTTDMIGSRLLFSGHGLTFKSKPLHAAFLGQDVLVVHDDAQLEPAFGKLLHAVARAQRGGRSTGADEYVQVRARTKDLYPLRFMELNSVPSGYGASFSLTAADERNPIVKKRIGAKKTIAFHKIEEERELAERTVELAELREGVDRAVIVIMRRLEDVERIAAKLPQGRVQALTEAMRGRERDQSLRSPIFQRFLPVLSRDPKVTPAAGTVYLVCTRAGEVGANLSGDDLVCDLATYEIMVRRLGRANRFGDCIGTRIEIVHPQKFDGGDRMETRRARALALLKSLDGDGSPKALAKLAKSKSEAVLRAFGPLPKIPKTSDILLDSWALTSFSRNLPGRPPVTPFLRGVSEWESPTTQVGWRDEVTLITGDLTVANDPACLIEDYPLKSIELLRDRSERVFRSLRQLAKRHPGGNVWIIDEDGSIEVVTLRKLTHDRKKERIHDRVVLLSPAVGGLRDGFLDGEAAFANDVSSEWRTENERRRRQRLWDEQGGDDGMRLIRTIDLRPEVEESVGSAKLASVRRLWNWYESPDAADNDGSKTAPQTVLWKKHSADVVRSMENIVQRLPISAGLRDAVMVAARHHDLGKQRRIFQNILGNRDSSVLLAKSGRRTNAFGSREIYRHEFGSLADVSHQPDFARLGEDLQQLVLHVIAAHHGRGRPHFSPDEAFDPDLAFGDAQALADAVPRRFARLQRRYGRWGLAYLESLLRAADYTAGARAASTDEMADSRV